MTKHDRRKLPREQGSNGMERRYWLTEQGMRATGTVEQAAQRQLLAWIAAQPGAGDLLEALTELPLDELAEMWQMAQQRAIAKRQLKQKPD